MELVQSDLLISVLNNMKITLNDLYRKLEIPNSAISKFNEFNIDTDYITNLFYEDEDKFFEFVEKNYKEKYLEILFIYLNIAIALYDKYLEQNIDLNIYYDTIDDIRIWANNCVKEEGIYGLKEIYWVNEHLRMRLFKLGRLQFQKRDASEFMKLIYSKGLNEYVKKDYLYFVHIPEGEKLTSELAHDSYKKAKDFYKDDMVFACESWMLSDKLELIMNENSNVIKFRNDYILLSQIENVNPIKRYLRSNSDLDNKVTKLEHDGILIGEGFGICIKYL